MSMERFDEEERRQNSGGQINVASAIAVPIPVSMKRETPQ
jgi:hypothetical protein